MSLVLFLPLVLIFSYALSGGLGKSFESLSSPDALSAIWLTVRTALIVVPINTLFGVILAWSVSKFEFRGKTLLITALDLPFAVSPVIIGMMILLLFGSRGIFGPLLQTWGVKIAFSTPGIILATLFVTFPFIARELISLMHAQGTEDELAATTLGASGWQTFFMVTLPNIKWGLLYGVLLTNARAMGEFGAVSVVSGHIRGKTNTIPLHVEILYNEYRFAAAFTIASVLVLLALVTLIAKHFAEASKGRKEKET